MAGRGLRGGRATRGRVAALLQTDAGNRTSLAELRRCTEDARFRFEDGKKTKSHVQFVSLGTISVMPESASVLYGVIDVGMRFQVVFFPGSSTDAIALLTLPVVVAPSVFAVSALGAWLWMQWRSDRTSRN